MTDHPNIPMASPSADEGHGTGHRGPSASQLDAAVEAAYILEAVRK